MLESASNTAKIVLVVDDHADILAFMRAALEGAGYEVHTAAEGAAGMALLRERGADVLITDIFMPGQEGFETIRRCKAEFPQTRIIVMSAGAVPGMTHDFLQGAGLLAEGATLRKPFSAEQLLEAVGGALQRR
jgi:CheY-like chemotaxis protein